jgi:REP element-mobilizing transposase RayT
MLRREGDGKHRGASVATGVRRRLLRCDEPRQRAVVESRDDRDREKFLEILSSVVSEVRWILHGYRLMGNHYHLLVETPLANLSRGMQRINGRYSQRFNSRHRRCIRDRARPGPQHRRADRPRRAPRASPPARQAPPGARGIIIFNLGSTPRSSRIWPRFETRRQGNWRRHRGSGAPILICFCSGDDICADRTRSGGAVSRADSLR